VSGSAFGLARGRLESCWPGGSNVDVIGMVEGMARDGIREGNEVVDGVVADVEGGGVEVHAEGWMATNTTRASLVD
jgi:hypothetical protein